MSVTLQNQVVDRTAITVAALTDPSGQVAYWRSRSLDERAAALETLRQIMYGYDSATARLSRVLAVVELGGR